EQMFACTPRFRLPPQNRDFSFPKRAAGSGASGGQPRAKRARSGRVTDSAKRPESVTARPFRVDRSEWNVSSNGERKRPIYRFAREARKGGSEPSDSERACGGGGGYRHMKAAKANG